MTAAEGTTQSGKGGFVVEQVTQSGEGRSSAERATQTVRTLHHVQVSCPPGGEDAARRFYRDALGMTELDKPAALAARGGAWFRSSGAEIHVGVEADFHPARKAHPALLVDDIDELARRIAAAGFSVEWDDLFPGFRRFHTADGNGNRVEILHPIPISPHSPAPPSPAGVDHGPRVNGPRVDGPRVDGPRVDGPRVNAAGTAAAEGG